MATLVLAIQRCPLHGVECITLATPDDAQTRLTGSKCCGRWTQRAAWRLDETALDAMRDALRALAATPPEEA